MRRRRPNSLETEVVTNTSTNTNESAPIGDGTMNGFGTAGENNSSNSDNPSNSNNNNGTSSAGRSRFSDGLVVMDPNTGIIYVNQSVMACNRNLTRRLARNASEIPYAAPIFWNRRMFVETTLSQPQLAVEIEDNSVISWLDYPPSDIEPRYCTMRYQMSCFRYIEEKNCWFFNPENMKDFCDVVRSAQSTIVDAGGYISDQLLELHKLEENNDIAPWDLSSASVNDSSVNRSVEFPDLPPNNTCTLRKFKGEGRSVRGMSFSLTMALNHETGVFVVSHESAVE
ncbi:hypothetical protein EGW08_019921, partial [Elysia chlorotica]